MDSFGVWRPTPRTLAVRKYSRASYVDLSQHWRLVYDLHYVKGAFADFVRKNTDKAGWQTRRFIGLYSGRRSRW